MTKSNRPRTLIQLAEYKLGRPLSRKELMKAGINDRRLTREEQRELIAYRKNRAREAREYNAPSAKYSSDTFVTKARLRVERWARHCNRLGTSAADAPAHIRDKVRDMLMAPLGTGEAFV